MTVEEARLGIAAGATGCTQNLSHPQAGEKVRRLLRETLRETDNDNEVECILQRKLVKKISDEFMPLWEKSHSRYGYVSIQGDPIHEEDADVIIAEGRKNSAMNPNIMVKIPATDAGLSAMRVLAAENTPLNATGDGH